MHRTIYHSYCSLIVNGGAGDDHVRIQPAILIDNGTSVENKAIWKYLQDSRAVQLLRGPIFVDGGAGPNNTMDVLPVQLVFRNTDGVLPDFGVDTSLRDATFPFFKYMQQQLDAKGILVPDDFDYSSVTMGSLRQYARVAQALSTGVAPANTFLGVGFGACVDTNHSLNTSNSTWLFDEGKTPYEATLQAYQSSEWMTSNCNLEASADRTGVCEQWTPQIDYDARQPGQPVQTNEIISLVAPRDATFTMSHALRPGNSFTFTMETTPQDLAQSMYKMWFNWSITSQTSRYARLMGLDTPDYAWRHQCGQTETSRCSQSFVVNAPSFASRVQEGMVPPVDDPDDERTAMANQIFFITLVGQLGRAPEWFNGLSIQLSLAPETKSRCVLAPTPAPHPHPGESLCRSCKEIALGFFSCDCRGRDLPVSVPMNCTGCSYRDNSPWACNSCRCFAQNQLRISVQVPLDKFDLEHDVVRTAVENAVAAIFPISNAVYSLKVGNQVDDHAWVGDGGDDDDAPADNSDALTGVMCGTCECQDCSKSPVTAPELLKKLVDMATGPSAFGSLMHELSADAERVGVTFDQQQLQELKEIQLLAVNALAKSNITIRTVEELQKLRGEVKTLDSIIVMLERTLGYLVSPGTTCKM